MDTQQVAIDRPQKRCNNTNNKRANIAQLERMISKRYPIKIYNYFIGKTHSKFAREDSMSRTSPVGEIEIIESEDFDFFDWSDQPTAKPIKKPELIHIKMSDLTKLEEIVRKGDLVVLDIDKTIMGIGSDKYTHHVLSLCPTIRKMVNNWINSDLDINVIIVTARRDDFESETKEQLKDINMENITVIHAPNDEHIPTKGIHVRSYIDCMAIKPKRCVIVDDMLKNHYDIKDNISLPLVHIVKIPGKMFESGNKIFLDNISRLHYIEILQGGTGGVHVYNSNFKHQKKEFVLKTSLNINHIKEEILADALYKSLGVPVPNFAVYDHYPYSYIYILFYHWLTNYCQ